MPGAGPRRPIATVGLDKDEAVVTQVTAGQLHRNTRPARAAESAQRTPENLGGAAAEFALPPVAVDIQRMEDIAGDVLALG